MTTPEQDVKTEDEMCFEMLIIHFKHCIAKLRLNSQQILVFIKILLVVFFHISVSYKITIYVYQILFKQIL